MTNTEASTSNFKFPLSSIPRISCNDPLVEDLISSMKPVVLMDTDLVSPALKWDLPYLEENLGSGDYTVFTSNSKHFKYYDENKLKELKNNNFVPPTSKLDLKIWEFTEKLKKWKPGDERLYLQQPLNDTVGKQVVDDFLAFNWQWIMKIQRDNNWGRLTSNLLLISTKGNVTPAHYDEQHNFFAQIRGTKRFILFPPEQLDCLYPHPVWHPHDRQSQVDFDDPDLIRFPKFKEIEGQEAILKPGDVLYLPMYWWHHVETTCDSPYSISVNFWYKAGPTGRVTYPLQSHQKVSVMRNIEKMLIETLKDVDEVGAILRTIVLGRYT